MNEITGKTRSLTVDGNRLVFDRDAVRLFVATLILAVSDGLTTDTRAVDVIRQLARSGQLTSCEFRALRMCAPSLVEDVLN